MRVEREGGRGDTDVSDMKENMESRVREEDAEFVYFVVSVAKQLVDFFNSPFLDFFSFPHSLIFPLIFPFLPFSFCFSCFLVVVSEEGRKVDFVSVRAFVASNIQECVQHTKRIVVDTQKPPM